MEYSSRDYERSTLWQYKWDESWGFHDSEDVSRGLLGYLVDGLQCSGGMYHCHLQGWSKCKDGGSIFLWNCGNHKHSVTTQKTELIELRWFHPFLVIALWEITAKNYVNRLCFSQDSPTRMSTSLNKFTFYACTCKYILPIKLNFCLIY